jgi:hypothetical protein
MSDDVYLQSHKITKNYDVTSIQLRELSDSGEIRFIKPEGNCRRRSYHIDDVKKLFDVKSGDKKLGAKAQRQKDNENKNEYVIKCGLDKSIKIDPNYKEAFIKEIRLRMIQTSRA